MTVLGPNYSQHLLKKTASSVFIVTASLAQIFVCGQERQSFDGYRAAKLQVRGEGRTGYSLLQPLQTQIRFTNELSQRRSLTNQVYLNGSGVAAGDVDGDGWCDLYFCGLDNENELYRNTGNWRF